MRSTFGYARLYDDLDAEAEAPLRYESDEHRTARLAAQAERAAARVSPPCPHDEPDYGEPVDEDRVAAREMRVAAEWRP